jgi:hypothetical protein
LPAWALAPPEVPSEAAAVPLADQATDREP